MATQFPDSDVYTGANKPQRFEADLDWLEVEGTIPEELAGTYIRVQPDPHFPPLLGEDIFFNGDGMVSRFQFSRGRVQYRQRYAKTDKWKAEQAAGRALFGAYRNPFTDDPSVAGMIRGTANTNVVFHAGKIWALKEDSPPLVMDPATLETEGYTDLDGRLTSRTFTAHPHIDPDTGEMIAIGFAAKGEATPDICYMVIDKDGNLVHEVWIEAPYSGMVHDFGVTKDYVIFPIVPITSNIEWLKEGKPHYLWDPRKDVYMGVLPRRGKAEDLRWFRGHNRYSTHVFNAWNEGEKIFIDTPVAYGNPFPFFPDITGAPFNLQASAPHVSRWIIDLASNGEGFEEERYSDVICEFPRIDDRFKTRKHRHGWISTFDYTKPWDEARAARPFMFMNTIGHFDFETKEMHRWWVGPESDLQEVQFVPRAAEVAEGDGWLMAIINRHAEKRSDLVILDALNIPAGPIATVHMPFAIRSGLHGNWIPESALPIQA